MKKKPVNTDLLAVERHIKKCEFEEAEKKIRKMSAEHQNAAFSVYNTALLIRNCLERGEVHEARMLLLQFVSNAMRTAVVRWITAAERKLKNEWNEDE